MIEERFDKSHVDRDGLQVTGEQGQMRKKTK